MGTREFPMTADPSTRVIQLEMASANYVPQGVSEQSGGQPFASNVFEAKAVIPKGLSIFVVGPARKHPPTPWTLSDEGPEFVLQICHRLDPRGDRPF